jgi:beta-lactamase superfamily II metal-dependent hydrolase
LQSLGLASSTDPAFRTFLAALRDKKVLLEEMHAGDTIELGQKVRADVLFPSPPETFSYSKASGPQAVLQIIYGDTSVIVLGDVSRKIQKFIAASHSVSTAVARTSSHGGAADDLSAELIDVATADFLVYSRKTSYAPPEAVAEKKSRVPHSLQDTRPIERINLRERGEVQIVSDGVRLSVLDTR